MTLNLNSVLTTLNSGGGRGCVLFRVHVLHAPVQCGGAGRSLRRWTAADALAREVSRSRVRCWGRSRRNELASLELGTLVDVFNVRPATHRLRRRLDAERQHAYHRHGPLPGVRLQTPGRRWAVGGMALKLPRLEVVVFRRRARRVARITNRRRSRTAAGCRLGWAGSWSWQRGQVGIVIGVVSNVVVV